ncbi:hypothetical protein TRE132_08720 [Pseudomonas chlororaphis subsp. aurantiaca]|nr:hypothetical protein TRE132_08720 [Pseudomonas chlororaphis subsp. aurantiaca]
MHTSKLVGDFQHRKARLLFLDFDGVLHPDAVYLTRKGVELRADGELFMWASLLSNALAEHQDVRIVLSTSWARNLGYQAARRALPMNLHHLVVGATWHSAMARSSTDYVTWDNQTRYQQIAAYLSRHDPVTWLAIDDDDEGWETTARERLILTPKNHGLSGAGVMDELIQKLGACS